MEEDAEDEDFVDGDEETEEKNRGEETEAKNGGEEVKIKKGGGEDTVDNDSTEDDEHNVLANWTAQDLLWAKNYLDTAGKNKKGI